MKKSSIVFIFFACILTLVFIKKDSQTFADSLNQNESTTNIPQTLFTFGFETGTLPSGWTESHGSATFGWKVGTDGGSTYWTIPDHTNYAYVSDDLCHCDMSDVWLISSNLDFSSLGSASMSFESFAMVGATKGIFTIKGSTNGGVTWVDLSTITSSSNWTIESVDLSHLSGRSNVKIAFHYNDEGVWGYGWAIDDIVITGTERPPMNFLPAIYLLLLQPAPPDYIVSNDNSKIVDESGTTDSFFVRLSVQPKSNVVIDISNSDPTELSLDNTNLTFTPSNWNIDQPVSFAGMDDPVIDGSQTSIITLSTNDALSDNSFDDLPNKTINVITVDNDVANFTVMETSGGTVVNERGTSDIFSVMLDVQPNSDVQISVVSADTGEATVDKSLLLFTPSNWSTPQVVTLTGVADNTLDGDQETTVTISVDDANSDDAFETVDDQFVQVTNLDHEFTVSPMSLTVSENGTTADFDVVLTCQPFIEDVVLNVTSGDTGEVDINKQTLTFTAFNWNTPQTVSVIGVDDYIIDGNQSRYITISVIDSMSYDAFDTMADLIVTVTTEDNDVAGINITEMAGSTIVDESGSTDAFDVALTCQPNSDVVLNVSSEDTGEVDVYTSVITFTRTNWNAPQTVTVMGVDDYVTDGPQCVNIILSVDNASSDDAFDGISEAVIVTNEDND